MASVDVEAAAQNAQCSVPRLKRRQLKHHSRSSKHAKSLAGSRKTNTVLRRIASKIPSRTNYHSTHVAYNRSSDYYTHYRHNFRPLPPQALEHCALGGRLKSSRKPPLPVHETPLQSGHRTWDNIGTRPGAYQASHLRVIEHVILPSEVLHVGKGLSHLRFPIDQSVAHGSTPATSLIPGSRFYLVRCVRVNSSIPSHQDWVLSDNVWPESIAICMNECCLEIPRKGIYRKDSPVDATAYIREGTNYMEVAVIGFPEGSTTGYTVGVEIVVVMDESTAKGSRTLLPWKEGRKRILDRIVDTDPDFVTTQLDLDLTDPMTSRICTTPTRGIFCRHNSCFDYEIFIQTHNGMDPTDFKCPVCRLDARPQSLVVDGFFLQVRQELEKRGRLDAKVITIDKDGEWVIKELVHGHTHQQVITIDDD